MFTTVAVIAAGACSSHDSGNDAGALNPGDSSADVTIAVDAQGVLPGSIRMAVPAYFPPGPEWQRVIAAAPTVGMVVINPASGPGPATNPQYAQVIAQARAAGIVVLGYVSTNYGQRAEADITADINAYYDQYSLSGLYLAEGPMESDCTTLEPEYRRLVDVAKGRDPQAYMAVGTHFCPTYVYFFDQMVEFAMSWSNYQLYVTPAWMPAHSPERFCHFISGVPAEEAGTAVSRAIANGAGWVFVTEQTEPNPWGQLPSYFDAELQAIRTLAP
jgi:Spherulation-specific family 4